MPIDNEGNRFLLNRTLEQNKRFLNHQEDYTFSPFIPSRSMEGEEQYGNTGGACNCDCPYECNCGCSNGVMQDDDINEEYDIIPQKKGKAKLLKVANGAPIEYRPDNLTNIVQSSGESFPTPQEKLDKVLKSGQGTKEDIKILLKNIGRVPSMVKSGTKRIKSVINSTSDILRKKGDLKDALNIMTLGAVHEKLGKADVEGFKKAEGIRKKRVVGTQLENPETLKKMGVKILKKGKAVEPEKQGEGIISDVFSSIGLAKKRKRGKAVEPEKQGEGIISDVFSSIGLAKKRKQKEGKGIISGILSSIGLGVDKEMKAQAKAKGKKGGERKLVAKEDLPRTNMVGAGLAWKDLVAKVKKENPNKPLKEILKIAKSQYKK